MGYSTLLYAVDLDQIQRMIDEHDTSILAPIREEDPNEYETRLDDNDPTTGEALEHIITEQDLKQVHAHQYGYALEVLCKHLGESLGDLTRLEWFRLNSPLEKQRTPFRIPDSDDFPEISYLTASETKAEVERLVSMDSLSSGDPEVDDMREAYLEYIKQAAEMGRAVVSFYH